MNLGRVADRTRQFGRSSDETFRQGGIGCCIVSVLRCIRRGNHYQSIPRRMAALRPERILELQLPGNSFRPRRAALLRTYLAKLREREGRAHRRQTLPNRQSPSPGQNASDWIRYRRFGWCGGKPVALIRHPAVRSRHHTKDKQRFVVSVVAYDSLPGHQTTLFHEARSCRIAFAG